MRGHTDIRHATFRSTDHKWSDVTEHGEIMHGNLYPDFSSSHKKIPMDSKTEDLQYRQIFGPES